MTLAAALQIVPLYVLVLCRLAGMMVFAPLLGSQQIPRRVKTLIVAILALSVARGLPPLAMPLNSLGLLAVGIGGEIIFGLAIGMLLSLSFIAAQWAGDIIGQQLGLNLSESFDPEFGSQGSLIGNLYFMLTLVIFISIGGHRAMLLGVRASFDALPLLSVGMSANLLAVFINLFQASTELAIQLAAPVMVTLLVVDLSLGFIGKTMPQLNVMSAGLTVRAVVGMVVMIVGIGLTSSVIRNSVLDGMELVWRSYTTPAVSFAPSECLSRSVLYG